MNITSITHKIREQVKGNKSLNIKAKFTEEGTLEIQPRGYGDCCSVEGTPVVFEIDNGKLRLLVWADINQEDATHIINLEGAREDKRN